MESEKQVSCILFGLWHQRFIFPPLIWPQSFPQLKKKKKIKPLFSMLKGKSYTYHPQFRSPVRGLMGWLS